MGIESDQVVYEYLSRVGDIAQQRQLPSAARMRLVSELRNEIDRSRAGATVDSPAAVRRILDRLGTPDEVVAAAGGTAGTGAVQGRPAAVPVQPEPERLKRLRRAVPRPRPAERRPEPPAQRSAASPPHLAPAHELGDSGVQPDWWRVAGGPFAGTLEDVDPVPGFVGGVEIPDLLKRPAHKPQAAGVGPAAEADLAAAEAAPARRRGPFARRIPAPAPAPASAPAPARGRLSGPVAGWSNPLLLLAAAALVAGAVLGNWFALLAGWLVAYGSRRLTPAESKWAVLVLPGTAAAAGLVWLWGRENGRWGESIAQGRMTDAVAQTWPWVVRGAAVASALYLVWRSQRKG